MTSVVNLDDFEESEEGGNNDSASCGSRYIPADPC